MLSKTIGIVVTLGIFVSRVIGAAQDVFPIPTPDREVITAANAAQLTDLGRLGLGQITGIVWSPQNNSLFAVAFTTELRLYDVTTPQAPIRVFPYDGWSLYSVAFSPDGTQIAAGDEKGFVYIWETETGNQRLVTQAHGGIVQEVAFSPDGRLFASAGDRKIRLWDVETLEEYPSLIHNSAVTNMAFLPNSEQLVSGAADTTLRLWNVSTHRAQSVVYFNDPIGALGVSPDSSYMVVSTTGFVSSDHPVRGWRLEGGQFGEELIFPRIPVHVSSDVTLIFWPDGRLLVAAGQGLDLWNLESGESITLADLWKNDPSQDIRLYLNDGPSPYAAISPDAGFIAFTDVDRYQLYLATTVPDSVPQPLLPPGGLFPRLAFADDGQSLLTYRVGSNRREFESELRRWDLRTGMSTTIPLEPEEYDEVNAYIENCEVNCILPLLPDQDEPTNVFVPCDEQSLVSPNNMLEAVCQNQSQNNRVVLLDSVTHSEIVSTSVSDRVSSLSFSPDSTKLLIMVPRTGRVWVMDTATGHFLFNFPIDATLPRFSPDGSLIATTELIGRTYLVALRDAQNGQILTEFVLPREFNTHVVDDLEFSPDGTLIAVIGLRKIYLLGIPASP